jgi:hypothetical protein
MLVFSLFVISLPVIELNDNECTKEGKVFEYQEEEDQGQANQGKQHNFLTIVYQSAWFIYCYSP